MNPISDNPLLQILEFNDLEEQINTWLGTFDNRARLLFSLLQNFELTSVSSVKLLGQNRLCLFISLVNIDFSTQTLVSQKIRQLRGFCVFRQACYLRVSFLAPEPSFVTPVRHQPKTSVANPVVLEFIDENFGDDYQTVDEMNYDDGRSH